MGKKCLLLCFSGTGNTLLVGRKIQAKLEKNGYKLWRKTHRLACGSSQLIHLVRLRNLSKIRFGILKK